jgi:hypothetical protein
MQKFRPDPYFSFGACLELIRVSAGVAGGGFETLTLIKVINY